MLTLTREELHALTGYSQAAKQKRWLEEHGVPYRDEGRLLVSRAIAERWLAGVDAPRYSGVNLAAVR